MGAETGKAATPSIPPTTALSHPAARSLPVGLIAWFVLLVAILGLDMVGIPAAYTQYASVCMQAAEDCRQDGLLTAEDVRTLRDVGLAPEVYAAYSGVILPFIITLGFAAVSAVIIRKRADEPVALFTAVMLLAFGGASVTGTMHDLAEMQTGLHLPVNMFDYVGQVAFGIFFYIFPDGRFVPRWTRWLAVVAGILFAINVFAPGGSLDLFRGPFFLVFIASLIFSQAYRFRRVSTPIQRQQTKWVLFGSAIALAGFSVLFALVLLIPALYANLLGALAIRSLINGFILLIPLSIGIAILRYRLWDIDIVMNRALVYLSLTSMVVVLYMLVVGGLGALLNGRGNLLLSIGATGLVAVLFAPLRTRVQQGVNRLMYGERDEPYVVISRLGQQLETTLSPENVLPTILRTVQEALRLSSVAIQIHETDEPAVIASIGQLTADMTRLPLIYQGERIGDLLLGGRPGEDNLSEKDRRLLAVVAQQIGVALHAALLRDTSARLASDLQRSRERLITAREEERRRLRRDLHDGLGPQLASLMMKAEAARDLISTDTTLATGLMDQIIEQTRESVTDIRHLVYALRPPALDDLGLAGALRAHAAQYMHGAIQVSLRVEEPLPTLAAAVEVAVYRIVQEALANVARHAEARTCEIVITFASGTLDLQIVDDGRGIPDEHPAGVGLASMRERAAELGGSLTIDRRPEGGTRVHARLPAASGTSEE